MVKTNGGFSIVMLVSPSALPLISWHQTMPAGKEQFQEEARLRIPMDERQN